MNTDSDAHPPTNAVQVPADAPAKKPRIWVVLLAFPLVFVAVGFTQAVVVAVALAVRGEKLDATNIDALLRASLSAPMLIGSSAAASLVLIVSSLGAAALSRGGILSRLRLHHSNLTAGSIALVLIGFLALSESADDLFALLGLADQGSLAAIRRAFANASPATIGMAVLVLGAGAGLAEELFFRGYLQTRLAQRWGRWPAIVATSACFGLVHFDRLHSPFALVVGIAFGWLTERTGSIRPAIAAHVTNNALAVLTARLLPQTLAAGTHAILLAALLLISTSCFVLLRPRLPAAPETRAAA